MFVTLGRRLTLRLFCFGMQISIPLFLLSQVVPPGKPLGGASPEARRRVPWKSQPFSLFLFCWCMIIQKSKIFGFLLKQNGGHCFFVEFFTKWNSNRNTFRLQRNIGCVPGKLREMRRGGQRRRRGHGGLKCRQLVSLKWVVEEQQLEKVDENGKTER